MHRRGRIETKVCHRPGDVDAGVSETGLPLSIDSASASASISHSINDTSRSNTTNLSSAEVADHAGKAALAASTARFTSRESESGIWEYTSPVAGLKLSRWSPDAASSNWPPI